jgi:hypothetical protein
MKAAKDLIELYGGKSMQKYDCHEWRLDVFWNEENEKCVKKNEEILKDIYNTFGKPVIVGKPKTLAWPDFVKMISDAGVIDDTFGAREIGTFYNLSMQTQIDEINNSKHMQMSYLEFLEAFARVADKAIGHIPDNYAAGENDELDKSAVVENKSDAGEKKSQVGSRNGSRSGSRTGSRTGSRSNKKPNASDSKP